MYTIIGMITDTLKSECTKSEKLSLFLRKKCIELNEKIEKYGEPNKVQIEKLLTTLTIDLRFQASWGKNIRVNLRHPDIAVRSVDRAFTSLGWNFQENKIKKTSSKVNKILDILETLARFFEKEYPEWLTESKEGKMLVRQIDNEKKLKMNGEYTKNISKVKQNTPVIIMPTKNIAPYTVHGSKKGGFPVTKEKRSRGKIVTIIRRVTGDQQALLKALRSKLGCGGNLVKTPGSINDNAFDIEIQGDTIERVKTFLIQQSCLKGISAANRSVVDKNKKGKSKGTKNKIKSSTEIKTQQPKLTLDMKTIKGMKPNLLKAQLKIRGLSTQGNRKELIQRLINLSIA